MDTESILTTNRPSLPPETHTLEIPITRARHAVSTARGFSLRHRRSSRTSLGNTSIIYQRYTRIWCSKPSLEAVITRQQTGVAGSRVYNRSRERVLEDFTFG